MLKTCGIGKTSRTKKTQYNRKKITQDIYNIRTL